MNCLIVAAGYGSRLSAISDSKPLAPLCGTPLIEHVVRRAAAAGATVFTIVTGHQAERLEAFLTLMAARRGLDLRTVRTPDWSRPNGYSVISGAERIDGDYLLLMADHLFDPAILRRLIEAPRGRYGVRLAIDRLVDGPLIDPADATRVEVAEDGTILHIGKTIARFNAIDTGAFLATPELAAAIAASIAAGGAGSLSEGVQHLAARGRAATLDIGAGWWIDVDDPAMHRLAEEALGAGALTGI